MKKPTNWVRLGAKRKAAFFANGRCTAAESTIRNGDDFVDGYRPKVGGHRVLSETEKQFPGHPGFYLNKADAIEAARKFRDSCRGMAWKGKTA